MKMHLAILSAAALLGSAYTSNAQFQSPVGSWDFVISGSGQQGIAILTFSNNYTFGGHEILVPKPGSGIVEIGRGGTDIDRGGGDTNSVSSHTNLFGYASVAGMWYYDISGRVIGNYSIVVDSASQTNLEGISFVGKVVPGKRFNLAASTQNGKIAFKGVPLQPVSDLTGYWNGNKTQNGQSFVEFFSLTPYDTNIYYTLDGIGPTYTFTGVCMASVQKKIAFTMYEVPSGSTNEVMRASLGSLSAKSDIINAKTKGVIEPNGTIRFNATIAPSIP